MLEMKRRGWSPQMIQRVTLDNPVAFMSQTPKFKLD
jgi:hypothetical protein